MSQDSTPATSRPGSPVTPLPNQTQYRFNWDRKGPESVSGTTTGPNDYFANAPPRLAHLFGGSTISLTIPALPNEWSSASQGFHAISTVLNNPHRKQAPPKAHSALPAVPPADLPRVRRKDFDSYLRAISADWEKLRQLHPSTSSSSEAELEIPPPPLASLDQVPRVFFNSDFDLSSAATFAEVTEANEADLLDPTALGHALPLLEKFSHYADTIEVHLAHEIALRSHSFFAALTNLNLLQSESTQCLSQISRLRGMLEEVDTGVAKRGLEIVKLEKKLTNLKAVESNVEGVKDVVGVTSQGRDYIGRKSWNEALGVVQKLEGMWEPSTAPPVNDQTIPEEDENEETSQAGRRLSVPLSSLYAFSALPNHLQSLTMEIATALSDELVEVLREDLSRRIDEGNKNRNSHKMKDRLTPLLEGLLQTQGLKEATLSWREVVLGEIRGVIQKQFPEFQLDEDGARTPIEADRPGLGAHLRSLSHHDFMTSLRTIYQSYLNAAEGLQAQVAIVGEVVECAEKLKTIASSSSPTTTTTTSSLTLVHTELQDTLTSSTELAHVLLSSLISSRSPSHSALPLASFVEVFATTWDFVISSEVICKKMIVALRGSVVSQARAWLKTFHDSKMAESAKGVESELWAPQDVNRGPWTNADTTMEVQRAVNVMVSSAMGDPAELGIAWLQQANKKEEATDASSSPQPQPNGKDAFSVPGPPGTPTKSSSPAPSSSSSSSAKSKHLMIEGQPFFTVKATSSVLLLLLEYLRIPVCLGLLTADAMQRVIEFLKAFNSRTCQVVLGAGAMRSAGLKNITAKHLALASQSLSIMIALIPYVRETFRRHLNPKQAVMLVEFDKLKRVFAAINHRLAEAYGKIELPHSEAKMRLLADARYLHQKLSSLKGVGGPNTMLETVVLEKSIPKPAGAQSPSPSPMPTPTRNNTVASPPTSAISNSNTTQRLKGLLSGRSLTFDKALPTPMSARSATLPPPPSSTVPKTASALSNGTSAGTVTSGAALNRSSESDGASGGSVSQHKSNGNASPLPPLPVEENANQKPALPRSGSSGFRQVEILPDSEAESKSPTVPQKDAAGKESYANSEPERPVDSSVTDRKTTTRGTGTVSTASPSQDQEKGQEDSQGLSRPADSSTAQPTPPTESDAVINVNPGLTESPKTSVANLPPLTLSESRSGTAVAAPESDGDGAIPATSTATEQSLNPDHPTN
ncbi:hypothetical protein D9758_000748 [Tetrapyrgos nigripes]|uniref:Vacuolar protein sorting-associated protein 54 C-terminal domain-containing protein n=1 Tax=Tetrapyrgos nigripes TaxID=182062 RepID=A0A8H5GZ79_9AGAR|nr:hypothetical protein D9758_000748 [Tetrapyrgos nigripes]